MAKVLVIRFADGKTSMKKMPQANPTAQEQQDMADAIAAARGKTISDFGLVDDTDLPNKTTHRLDYDKDITVSGGVVSIDSLTALKKQLKKTLDLRTGYLIYQGFEVPPAAEPAAAGSGYVVGDVLTVSGGTFTTAAQVKVVKVGSGGEVERVGPTERGAYTAFPASPASTTGGTGTGCTLTLGEKGTTLGGNFFSLSDIAQINWGNFYQNRNRSKALPQRIPFRDDDGSLILTTIAQVEQHYETAYDFKAWIVAKGAELKDNANAAADSAAAQAAFDADDRTDFWGVAPPF